VGDYAIGQGTRTVADGNNGANYNITYESDDFEITRHPAGDFINIGNRLLTRPDNTYDSILWLDVNGGGPRDESDSDHGWKEGEGWMSPWEPLSDDLIEIEDF